MKKNKIIKTQKHETFISINTFINSNYQKGAPVIRNDDFTHPEKQKPRASAPDLEETRSTNGLVLAGSIIVLIGFFFLLIGFLQERSLTTILFRAFGLPLTATGVVFIMKGKTKKYY